jgi:hypothetical protein
LVEDLLSSHLKGTRAYLSGPMDFVASRANEQKFGWRNRVKVFLERLGVTVFDPWLKPGVRGLHDYGREGINASKIRDKWTFETSKAASEARAGISGRFWETMHIDLRMVDVSDFVIAYCPTSIYSVGTPHEIVTARQERKPVLLVSPSIEFPALHELRNLLTRNRKATELLDRLVSDVPIQENPNAIPSPWYMSLVGGERMFDGFGFKQYANKFGWKRVPVDDEEAAHPPVRPLLPFLMDLNEGKMPKKWDNRRKQFVRDDDWLLFNLEKGNSKRTAN